MAPTKLTAAAPTIIDTVIKTLSFVPAAPTPAPANNQTAEPQAPRFVVWGGQERMMRHRILTKALVAEYKLNMRTKGRSRNAG